MEYTEDREFLQLLKHHEESQTQKYIKELYDLYLDIQRDGYWDVKQHRFLIHARAI